MLQNGLTSQYFLVTFGDGMFRPLNIIWIAGACIHVVCCDLCGASALGTGKSGDAFTESDDAELNAKLSSRAKRRATALRLKILAEIKKGSVPEWAGEYYAGDGLAVNMALVLAPASGYVFEWHGCLGLYDRNYGAVQWTNNIVRLSFTFRNTRKGFQGIAPEFLPISWGPRRYFVPTDNIIGFCNEVNQGSEPRMAARGSFLLRKGDEKKTVTGWPNVPAEYRSCLFAKPIDASIVAIGSTTIRPSAAEWKFKDTLVTIDAGSAKGLRAGLELIVIRPENLVESVRLTKVEEHRAEGIVTQIGENESDPAPGWRLSTRAPWHEATRGQ